MAQALNWRTVLALVGLLVLPNLAEAGDRNWSFSVSGFGGRSFSEGVGVDVHCGAACASPNPPWWGTAHGVQKTDAPSWGAKATAWYLRKQHDWQPQIGIELDWTRFITSQHAQSAGASGTTNLPGTQIGAIYWLDRTDYSTNILALNLLFRYPMGVSASLPEGRWYPYVGIGGGVQRTRATNSVFGTQELSYAPEWQAVAGVKLFLFRNLAIFGEWKRTSATHTFSSGFPDYKESIPIVSNHVTGGLSLHF